MNVQALAAALRAKAGAKPGMKSGPPPGDQYGLNAPMRDAFDYVNNVGNSADAWTPNETSGGEAGMGSTSHVPWEAVTSGGGDNASQTLMPGIADRYRSMVTARANGANGEGSGGYTFEFDDSKAPQTGYGGLNRTAPVNAHTPLFNPQDVRYDPNYGLITDARNVRPDQVNSYASAALMSAAMMGMGALGMPALATGLVGAGRSFGGGDTGGGIGSLLGAVGGAFGLPSWATSGARLALAAALRDRGGKT